MGMHCARLREYHNLGLTRIQFHSPKVSPLTNPAEVTDQDSATATLMPGDDTTAIKVEQPSGGRGAGVSECADLTNQLLSCWVVPHMCLEKTLTQQL